MSLNFSSNEYVLIVILDKLPYRISIVTTTSA